MSSFFGTRVRSLPYWGLPSPSLVAKSCSPFAPAVLVAFAAVPIPGTLRLALAEPLQNFASGLATAVLDLAGVSAVRTGNTIEINGVLVAVGEACNGMRLLIPLGLVIYTFVFSLPLRPVMRGFLLLSSIPVALLCNVVRLVPTAIAYGYLPSQATLIHDVGGWIMLPAAIFILIGLLRLIEWIDIPVSRWRLVTA